MCSLKFFKVEGDRVDRNPVQKERQKLFKRKEERRDSHGCGNWKKWGML